MYNMVGIMHITIQAILC